MADVLVRGEQNGRQFAGQADQGPVGDRLLLGFDLFRVPPKLPGPQDGGDTPPEPLGRLPLPQLVFGILARLPWDFLLWRAGESREDEKRVGRKKEVGEFTSSDKTHTHTHTARVYLYFHRKGNPVFI